MNKFHVKKVENCFKDSQTYEYKINMEINEGFLDKLENLGKIEIKNFRRPIFMIDCENKNKIFIFFIKTMLAFCEKLM